MTKINPKEYYRKPTQREYAGGTARQRGFMKMPEIKGYFKAYKPYGTKGSGYYYEKV